MYCNQPKTWTRWCFLRVMHPKDAEGIANSVDPPRGAVWSGSALFAQAYLSENLGTLWYDFTGFVSAFRLILSYLASHFSSWLITKAQMDILYCQILLRRDAHFWDLGEQCRPRSDAANANAASDQCLHCLLTGISIQNRMKMKKYTRHP